MPDDQTPSPTPASTPSTAAAPRRVVISGIGAITAAGPTAPDLWRALLDGRPCLAPVPAELVGAQKGDPAVAGRIADFEGPAGVPDRFRQRIGRAAQLALEAAIQAIADARITFTAENAFHVGAVIGGAHGSGARPADGWPFLSSGLSGVTIGLNIAGPTFSVAADGASGAVALLEAARLIRDNAAHVVIAGGADAPLTPEVWAAYRAAGLLSHSSDPAGMRPFDARRDGVLLAEGAAVLVLEDRDLAMQRGARIYAELTGGALTAGPPGDGAPPTDVDIARRAIGGAIRDSGKAPGEIDVVFAAGLATPEGDKRETDVLERSFGARIQDMYVTAVTPALGYTVGAAGALSAAAAALCIAEGVVPPHATYATADPECGLDIATHAQRDNLYGALVSAYGALGQNASLLIMRHQAEPGDPVPVLA